ncbi:hypothetical protein ANO11243_067920 [Dothideomycetidae sp. 11243]|nr:hypothetical protein ANO11243_067920 [fungal sp. No.11243]
MEQAQAATATSLSYLLEHIQNLEEVLNTIPAPRRREALENLDEAVSQGRVFAQGRDPYSTRPGSRETRSPTTFASLAASSHINQRKCKSLLWNIRRKATWSVFPYSLPLYALTDAKGRVSMGRNKLRAWLNVAKSYQFRAALSFLLQLSHRSPISEHHLIKLLDRRPRSRSFSPVAGSLDAIRNDELDMLSEMQAPPARVLRATSGEETLLQHSDLGGPAGQSSDGRSTGGSSDNFSEGLLQPFTPVPRTRRAHHAAYGARDLPSSPPIVWQDGAVFLPSHISLEDLWQEQTEQTEQWVRNLDSRSASIAPIPGRRLARASPESPLQSVTRSPALPENRLSSVMVCPSDKSRRQGRAPDFQPAQIKYELLRHPDNLRAALMEMERLSTLKEKLLRDIAGLVTKLEGERCQKVRYEGMLSDLLRARSRREQDANCPWKDIGPAGIQEAVESVRGVDSRIQALNLEILELKQDLLDLDRQLKIKAAEHCRLANMYTPQLIKDLKAALDRTRVISFIGLEQTLCPAI